MAMMSWLCRRRLRYVVAACLGASVLASLVLILGTAGNATTLLVDETHGQYQPRDTIGRLDGVASTTSMLRIVLRQKNNKRYGKKKDDSEDNAEADTDYYNNEDEEDDPPVRKNPVETDDNKPKNQGFVIEDNAADYKDYDDDDEDEDYKEEDYEDDYNVNPAFKPGDFDYNMLLNKSALKVDFEEVPQNKPPANGSHVYNAVQYKSMHLLENTPERKVGHNYEDEDDEDTEDEHLALKSSMLKQVVRHDTDRILDKTKDYKVLPSNAARLNKLRSQNKTASRHNLSPEVIKERITNSENAWIISDSRTVAHQWIETQIPIQDGNMDANWLLQDQPATQIQMPELPWQPGEVRSPNGIPLIVDKIFWSKEVVDLIPKGVTPADFQHFLHKLYTTPVREMMAPQWNRCGRPRNQYVVLQDGTALCARHREEHSKLIHGEVLSFYLSRILGLDNVPIVVLSRAASDNPQWRGMDLAGAGWNESSLVALIEWVDGLASERSRVKMPYGLLEAFETGGVFDRHHRGVSKLTANNLTELVQWSDMVLFDYLTGHYDRVASMQDGALREQKPSIMHENIRNLRKVWQTSKMWLIDNESGLYDGYELLYHGGEMGRSFVDFHKQMLRTNCIFRRETVQKISQLAALSRPHEELVRYSSAQDPLYSALPYAKESALFEKYFHVRLKEVMDWVNKCRSR